MQGAGDNLGPAHNLDPYDTCNPYHTGKRTLKLSSNRLPLLAAASSTTRPRPPPAASASWCSARDSHLRQAAVTAMHEWYGSTDVLAWMDVGRAQRSGYFECKLDGFGGALKAPHPSKSGPSEWACGMGDVRQRLQGTATGQEAPAMSNCPSQHTCLVHHEGHVLFAHTPLCTSSISPGCGC
jgi:hypothetical protein